MIETKSVESKGLACSDVVHVLADRLVELGQWPGFVANLRETSSPHEQVPDIYAEHGKDPVVKGLLNDMGWTDRTLYASQRGRPLHPCEGCERTDCGSFRERGFNRCNGCGYPGQ